MELIHRSVDASDSKVLPRRRAVERTFGWMRHWRRLVREYEKRLEVSDAIYLTIARDLAPTPCMNSALLHTTPVWKNNPLTA